MRRTKAVLEKALELAGLKMWSGGCPWEAGELDDDDNEPCPIAGLRCNCECEGGVHAEDCGYCLRFGDSALEAGCWAELMVRRAEKALRVSPLPEEQP
jgi:hypothetical protein